MVLKTLAEAAPCLISTTGDMKTQILSLCIDSRKVQEGALFFCTPGMKADAHDYAPQAVKAGAAALVVERILPLDVPQILVKNVRQALSYMAAEFYGDPAEHLHLIGLTGTKGKTTTSYLIKSILEEAGFKTGLIGTVCSMIGEERLPSTLTTPDPLEFQHLLRLMADKGVTHVVMEVSAHALDMERVSGMVFDAAAFTNLSQDHMDYFGDMERYLAAKMRLFEAGMCRKAVYNCDDDIVRSAMQGITAVGVGIREPADVFAKNIEVKETGYEFDLVFYKRARVKTHIRLSGMFNVYNALVAAAVCEAVGIDHEVIARGLYAVSGVPGRMEMLETDTPYRVILDYAHSPDALENILTAVRQMCQGRVVALFGCGGDRDREKRPIMGEISGNMADYTIITSDNPRTEDPYEILKAIEEGMQRTDGDYTVIENRREAIRYGLSMCRENDVLILAGKGHETYQEINGVKHPFDEKTVVKELLSEMRDM
ncbi:MAG: UDP-N-acetylmuramoyl-L-alanyl-D-glutamate--2,6-diaminopimelate ligase [Clostridia bacterium]|nr:UDP-N-acetylmuramoyl-L-alanyl-D-glutamate--2,6-diaminopimelate ligase [Clostridia bacterium]